MNPEPLVAAGGRSLFQACLEQALHLCRRGRNNYRKNKRFERCGALFWKERLKGGDQLARGGAILGEAVMPIECRGILVLRIDNQRENGEVTRDSTVCRAGEHDRAELASAEAFVDGKTSNTRRRYGRISRQATRQFGWKVCYRDIRRREGIVSGDLASVPFLRDEAGGQAAPDVLPDLLTEVAVQRFDTAVES